MKRNLLVWASAGLAFATLTSTAIAAPAAKAKTAAVKCPACGMMMPIHVSSTMTVPVKVGKTQYYCCDKCPAGQKALAEMRKKHVKKH